MLVSSLISKRLMRELGFISNHSDLTIESSPHLKEVTGADLVIESEAESLSLVLLWWSQVQDMDEKDIYRAYERSKYVGLVVVLDSPAASPMAWGRILEWTNVRGWSVPILWAYTSQLGSYHLGRCLSQVVGRIEREGIDSLFVLHRNFKLERYSPARAFYETVPGIGRKLSREIEKRYPTIMSLLEVDEGKVRPKRDWWESVEGVGAAKGIALNVGLGARRVEE